MKIFKFLFIFIFSLNVFAAEMKINAAHIKANQPGQNITAGFIKILSDSTLKITQINSKDAKKIEIHSMRMEKGPYGDSIMKMRKIENPTIQANKEYILMPGGDHLMIYGLKKQLNPNDTFEINFVLEDENNYTFEKNISFKVY